jgi:hypothetical protein
MTHVVNGLISSPTRIAVRTAIVGAAMAWATTGPGGMRIDRARQVVSPSDGRVELPDESASS